MTTHLFVLLIVSLSGFDVIAAIGLLVTPRQQTVFVSRLCAPHAASHPSGKSAVSGIGEPPVPYRSQYNDRSLLYNRSVEPWPALLGADFNRLASL